MKRIMIGRNATHDYVVDAISVSRNHAEISVFRGVITLTDLKSANGTYVLRNNQRHPIERTNINSDDVLYFGDSGPHKVSDILHACRESTERVEPKLMLNKEGQPIEGPQNKNRNTVTRVRCLSCGSVVSSQYTLCPDCGGVVVW